MTEWVRCLEFTTVSSCAVNCSYCPQGVLGDAYKGPRHLRLREFRKVVDTLPVDVIIHFSGFVEPWLNPECTEMLEYALSLGRRVAVYTTTIGMAVVVDEARMVADLLTKHTDLVDHVCIHLPDVDGNMPRKPKPEAIEAFRSVPRVEWMSMGAPVEAPGAMNEWNPIDRAGNLAGKQLPLVRHVGPIRCSYTPTYEHNVMLPNGDVVLCCMDYQLRHPVGNLFRQSWDELHVERERIRQANLTGGDTICRRCSGAEPA